MTPLDQMIFLVSADPALNQKLISELVAAGSTGHLSLAMDVAQACKGLRRMAPAVILLDESALSETKRPADTPAASLDQVVAKLAEWAPVVVVAAPERQAELASLMATGGVDFVARVGGFVPVAVGLLQHRVRLAERVGIGAGSRGPESTEDFGEILRHEVNNPLTGILGNAELLLAECKKRNGTQMSLVSIERLQTIAELAVRLRETVRRLSNVWDSRSNHARSA